MRPGSGRSFLFSSDFHGEETAFRGFARTLASGPFAAGILAGDLLDEWMPPDQVHRLVPSDAQPLPSPADRLARALEVRQGQLQALLETSGKPIFFVLGNHDVTPWMASARMTDLHGQAVTFEGRRLVGYRWTRMDRYPDELEADLPALSALVDPETVLVTHSPPWGVLDGRPGSRFRFGLKGLHRLPVPRLHLFGHVHECAGVEGYAVNGAWPALRRFFAVDPEDGTAKLVEPLPP